MAGDYSKYRRHYEDLSFDYDLATATGGPVTLLTARNAKYQIYIQKISIDVGTYSAKVLTFADSAGTPVEIASSSIPGTEPTNAGAQNYEHDFGSEGTALTVGKNLVLTLSGAGVAARIHVACFQRLASTGFIGDTAANQ